MRLRSRAFLSSSGGSVYAVILRVAGADAAAVTAESVGALVEAEAGCCVPDWASAAREVNINTANHTAAETSQYFFTISLRAIFPAPAKTQRSPPRTPEGFRP